MNLRSPGGPDELLLSYGRHLPYPIPTGRLGLHFNALCVIPGYGTDALLWNEVENVIATIAVGTRIEMSKWVPRLGYGRTSDQWREAKGPRFMRTLRLE